MIIKIIFKHKILYPQKNNIDINNNTLILIGCYSECWNEKNKNNDEDIIILKISKITNVYRRSTEVMNKYKIYCLIAIFL